MKGGILEVLLVSAEGLRHTNLIGKSTYYVIIECGTQVHRSKTSEGDHGEVYWNEKFTFEFPLSEWEKSRDLKLKIMDEQYFSDGAFVGETMIYLEHIIVEGTEGVIELLPAPYNVVLEDDTYKGEIKIGLTFTSNQELLKETRSYTIEEKEPAESLCQTIMNLWKTPWWRFVFFHKDNNSEDEKKEF